MSQSTTKPNETSRLTDDARRQTQIERNQALIVLLNAWEQEDTQEQRDTLEVLVRALDEDRPSSRNLFAQQ